MVGTSFVPVIVVSVEVDVAPAVSRIVTLKVS